MTRWTVQIAIAVVVVLAVGLAAALVVTGGDESPSDVSSAPGTEQEGTTMAAPDTAPPETRTERADQGRDSGRTEPAPEPEPTPTPTPVRYETYFGSSGDWQTVVPSGAGWRPPLDSSGSAGGGRTTVHGPDGATLVLEHSPTAPARGARGSESKRELSHPTFGSMTEYTLAGGSVAYVMNAGAAGPGFRIVAAGVDAAVARRVAESLTYVDL